ncbi:snapalysin [Streptomyces sp. NPDC101181]|uniref:snapalysin n=1 Tax=Streptomyces sp. NPDC101181 TaxID=3366125 RepID=UPI00380EB55E
MRHLRTAVATAAAGLGLVATLGGAPAVSAAPAPSASTTSTAATVAAYNGSAESAAANKAFFDAVMKSAAAKRAAGPAGTQAVTVTYSAASAPSFRTQIANSTRIWNSSVTNVRLQEGSNADFTYREGNDPRGSYASTNGHGRGFIFLDYRQNQQYNSTRVTTHETGHVLGLPDTYSGPCSQLMSGGGPGPSCTNAQPDANERARVNQLWRNGFAAALARSAS